MAASAALTACKELGKPALEGKCHRCFTNPQRHTCGLSTSPPARTPGQGPGAPRRKQSRGEGQPCFSSTRLARRMRSLISISPKRPQSVALISDVKAEMQGSVWNVSIIVERPLGKSACCEYVPRFGNLEFGCVPAGTSPRAAPAWHWATWLCSAARGCRCAERPRRRQSMSTGAVLSLGGFLSVF